MTTSATVTATQTETEIETPDPITVSATVVSTVPTTVDRTIRTTTLRTVVKTVPKTVRVTVTSQPAGKTVGNGDYLVGRDIETGTWQCRDGGGRLSLYWETDTKSGDIIDNDLGSIARVLSNAYTVKLSGCNGDWTKVD
jgi:hypothetical protein